MCLDAFKDQKAGFVEGNAQETVVEADLSHLLALSFTLTRPTNCDLTRPNN